MKKLMIVIWAVALLSIAQISKADFLKIIVTNPIDSVRDCETVEVDMNLLTGYSTTKPGIYDDKLKKFIPCQVIDKDSDGTNDLLVFQTDMKALQTKTFTVYEPNTVNQETYQYGAVANYVPQRKDDFAWENDKIAFRMYGQELQRTELTSSGIDVWVKKVPRPVMMDLYKKGHDYYHGENPLGIDFYDVGKTLGCGGLGVWDNGKLLTSENAFAYKIIANGPIRVIFELGYKPWDMGEGRKFAEVKRITLDRGSNFNRIESKFDGNVEGITFAVGLAKCLRGGKSTYSAVNEYLTYWQRLDKVFGTIGCGIALPKETAINKWAEDTKNCMLLVTARDNKVTYYAGACWNKNLGYENEQNWVFMTRKMCERANNPLKIEIKEKISKNY